MKKNKIIVFEADGGVKRTLDITDMFRENPMVILKKYRNTLFSEDPSVQCHEGCDFIGYLANGDSFLFTQGIGFDEKEHRRTIFCLSRSYLEKVLRQYPPVKEEKK